MALLGVSGLFPSCESLDEGSTGAISSDSYYADELSLESGVIGMYGILQRAGWGVDVLAAYTGADDLSTHDAGNKWVFTEGDQFKFTDGNPRTNGIWSGYYKVINACNLFLEKANPEGVNEAVLNNAHANAHFLRGMLYFRLTTIFGDIPMPLSSQPDYAIEKTPTAEVMDQVILDLEFAMQWANNTRDTNPTVADGHVSKTAAKAFLAKTLMQLTGYPYNQTQHWTRVKQLTKEIIDGDVYSLMDDYSANFEYDRQINREIIWAHQFQRQPWPIGTECRWYGDFWRNWMDMFLEWTYFNNYPAGWRKNYCVTDQGTLASQYNHPILTKLLFGTEKGKPEFVHTWQSHNDMPGMRYAEVLLMYAEACARTNTASEGYEALNQVRRRAYANNLTTKADVAALPANFWETANPAIDYTTAEGDFIDAILTERLYEFTAEVGGNRWLDLVRLQKVGEANANRDSRELPLVGDPSSPANWYAKIPGDEVRLNPNLAN